jgi:hypothetical protein
VMFDADILFHRGLPLNVDEVRVVELQPATEFADFEYGITAS